MADTATKVGAGAAVVKSFEQIMREKREREAGPTAPDPPKRPRLDNGTAGAGTSGAGTNGAGTNGAGTTGAGTNGAGTNGVTATSLAASANTPAASANTPAAGATGTNDANAPAASMNELAACGNPNPNPNPNGPSSDVVVVAAAGQLPLQRRQRSKWSDDESDDEPLQGLPGSGRGSPMLASPAVADSPKRSPTRSPTPDEENDSSEDEDVYCPALSGCRNVDDFERLNRIEEGTYGVVYRVRDKFTGEVMALKRLKMEKEKDGFPITALREVNTLLKCKHENIVSVQEIVVGSNMDLIYIVMEFIEHDLKSLLETMKQPFAPSEVKTVMLQLLAGVHHMHDNWMLHRDLKTSNLLMSHKGVLKIADFGLAREYGSPLRNYTQMVVTLWYRPPELLLGTKTYSTAVDIWSVGCIMSEVFTQKALFPSKGEIDTIKKIFKKFGTPSERIWAGYNKLPYVQKINFTEYPASSVRNEFSFLTTAGFDLLMGMLTYDPKQRISAEDALEHPYFKESPRPMPAEMFPHWPAKSEGGAKPKNKAVSPKLGGDDDSGFNIEQEARGAVYDGAPAFSLRFG